MPACLDIMMQRNEDYAFHAVISDDEGVPIDITGWTFSLQVRERLNNLALVEAATVSIDDPTAGGIDVLLRGGPSFPLGVYGNPIHEARLPYDLLATDAGGVHVALFAGDVILKRGVSSPA